jgi:hypothetical protein
MLLKGPVKGTPISVVGTEPGTAIFKGTGAPLKKTNLGP